MGWTVRGPLTEHFCAGSCPGSSSSFSFPAARKQMWDTRHPAGPGSFLHYDIAVQACGGCVHRGVAAVFCSVIDALRNLGFIIQQMLLSIIIMRQRTLRGSETWGLCCRTAAVGQLRGSGAGWEGSLPGARAFWQLQAWSRTQTIALGQNCIPPRAVVSTSCIF